MQRKALEAMARHLRTIPNDRNFDMRIWRVVTPSCRTVGCAIGHCIGLPEVKATGLMLDNGIPVLQDIAGQDREAGLHYVAAALELNILEAQWLFSPESYPERSGTPLGAASSCTATPNDVANRIEELLLSVVRLTRKQQSPTPTRSVESEKADQPARATT